MKESVIEVKCKLKETEIDEMLLKKQKSERLETYKGTKAQNSSRSG